MNIKYNSTEVICIFFSEGEAEGGLLPTRQQRGADRRTHYLDCADGEYCNKHEKLYFCICCTAFSVHMV